jgi:chemotaxis protein MotB
VSAGGGGQGFVLEEEEEHENHERYLITYADMITLLLALFIILFAIGQVDTSKYDKLRAGLADAFGNRTFVGGSGVLEGEGPAPIPDSGPAGVAPEGGIGTTLDLSEAEQVAEELRQDLIDLEIAEDKVGIKIDERGLVITFSTDDVTFASGSWQLRPAGVAALDRLFGPLAAVDNEIMVEGHTDDRPMGGGLSNWELSANRAGAVVRYLIDQRGLDPKRMSAAGYADVHPIADNGTAQGRQQNRRVEMVIVIEDIEPASRPVPPTMHQPV